MQTKCNIKDEEFRGLSKCERSVDTTDSAGFVQKNLILESQVFVHERCLIKKL